MIAVSFPVSLAMLPYATEPGGERIASGSGATVRARLASLILSNELPSRPTSCRLDGALVLSPHVAANCRPSRDARHDLGDSPLSRQIQ